MNLKDLSQIDIKDLKNINLDDLKNIDVGEYVQKMKSRPDILINLGIIVVTIVLVIGSFYLQGGRAKTLKKNIAEMEDKLKTIEKNKIVQKRFDTFTKDFPQTIPSYQLIDKLSEFAVNRDIQILAFSPAKDQIDDFKTITTVNIDVSTDNYRDLVQFINDIEEAPFTIRVDSWSGVLKNNNTNNRRRGRNSAATQTVVPKTVESRVAISSIRLNDE